MTTIASYPFLRGDALYLKHPQGAVVKDANGSYLVKGETVYDWLAAVTPLLDGSRSVDQITAKVPEGTQTTAEQLIDLLVSRGTARLLEGPVEETGTSELSELESFLANWSATPRTDAQRFKNTPVAVLGDDAIAPAFLQNLKINGVQHAAAIQDLDDLKDFSGGWVFATTTVSASTLHKLSEEARSGAFGLLYVLTLDNKLIIGPLIDEHSPVRGIDVVINLVLRNASSEARIAWWEYETLNRPLPTELSPAVSEIVGVNAAFETFREITGALPSQLREAALVVDATTLDSTVERVIDPFSETSVPVDSEARPDSLGSQNGVRIPHIEQEQLDTLLALISPHTGLFSGFNDEDDVQEPLFVARIKHGWAHPALLQTGIGISTETFADARGQALLSALSACSATVAEVRQGWRLSSQSIISSAFDIEAAAHQAQWIAVEEELFHCAMRSSEVVVIDDPIQEPMNQLLWNHLHNQEQAVTLLHWHALPAPFVMAVLTDKTGKYLQASRAAAGTLDQAISTALTRLAGWTQVGLKPPGIDTWFHLDIQQLPTPTTRPTNTHRSVELKAVMAKLHLVAETTDITPSSIARLTPARTVHLQWKGAAHG